MEDSIKDFQANGYCILKQRLAPALIDACRQAFWLRLQRYLEIHSKEPNRGPNRHFVPMPFDRPCFAPEFFFHEELMQMVRTLMGDRVVVDQWGCDVALPGSEYQGIHVDYRRPLFGEVPDLPLPIYMLVVNFGLSRITSQDGPIEIAPGTHCMPRNEALRGVEEGEIKLQPVELEIGDVLLRHPWAIHRGSPNVSSFPRTLVGIRYVRSWYVDNSRDVEAIPRVVWESLTSQQQAMMRFPLE
jgi:ectoine hydroxylase-related dioxygenase (phytanoyl-CoA dioxygenase family)